MSMHLWQVLHWAHEDREVLHSAEKCAASVREECAYFSQAGFAQNAARAGAYPAGLDGGWRYDFTLLPMHHKLLNAYGLQKIAGEGGDFDRVLRLMEWLCAHTWYNGGSIWSAYLFQRRENSAHMLRYAFDKPFARALNCKHRALLLADCLLALGICAMPLWLRNESRQDDGSVSTFKHCVVHAWLGDERRWVMLDPSFDSYVTDENGRALHLVEIHERYRKGEHLGVAQYAFNGKQDCEDIYLECFLLASLRSIYMRGGTKDHLDPRNCLSPGAKKTRAPGRSPRQNYWRNPSLDITINVKSQRENITIIIK